MATVRSMNAAGVAGMASDRSIRDQLPYITPANDCPGNCPTDADSYVRIYGDMRDFIILHPCSKIDAVLQEITNKK